VDHLVLKLVLTPALIGAATLTGRRWGPAVGGWLVGFPFTSAPVALFLALGHGAAFAADAAVGTMSGAISQAAFCVTYGWLAPRWGWAGSVAVSTLAFALATVGLERVSLALVPTFVVVVAVLALALRLMPGRTAASPTPSVPPPAWDVPARMVVATVFVLLLTGLASTLGARLTGLLTPFPLYGATLAVFTHHFLGPTEGADVLRGLLVGLFAFATFFLVLAALLQPAGLGIAFAAAVALTVVVQAGALWVVRRRDGGGTRALTARSR
jgi:hypothetical protein